MFRGLDIPRTEKKSIMMVVGIDLLWLIFAVPLALHILGVVDIPLFAGTEDNISPQCSALASFGGIVIFLLNMLVARLYFPFYDNFTLKIRPMVGYLVNVFFALAAIGLSSIIRREYGWQNYELIELGVSVLVIADFLLVTYLAIRARRREMIHDDVALPDKETQEEKRHAGRERLIMYALLAYDALWVVVTAVFGGYEPGSAHWIADGAVGLLSGLTLVVNVAWYFNRYDGVRSSPPFSASTLRAAGIAAAVVIFLMYTVKLNVDLPNQAWVYMVLPLPFIILVAYVSLRTLMWRGDKDAERGPWE